jgi:hypothetical protein
MNTELTSKCVACAQVFGSVEEGKKERADIHSECLVKLQETITRLQATIKWDEQDRASRRRAESAARGIRRVYRD